MKLSTIFAAIAVSALVVLLVLWVLVTGGATIPYVFALTLFIIEAGLGAAAFLLWINGK